MPEEGSDPVLRQSGTREWKARVASGFHEAHLLNMSLIKRLGLDHPIIQAPMAGVSTPAMAVAVSNAGALGSIAVGAAGASAAGAMMAEVRAGTARAFNVNLFVHTRPRRDAATESAWREALAPLFAQFGAEPPQELTSPYVSFAEDDAMLAVLLASPPPVVSFHFGLPGEDRIRALKSAGCLMVSTATNEDEARAAEASGIDAVVAQGYEAGGHRGMFDPSAPDEQLSTLELTRRLSRATSLPVIAAGGLMDGRDIRAALDAGAVAAQLGTAFLLTPESAADAGYRAALAGDAARHTVMTDAISGRPARSVQSRFTEWAEGQRAQRPDYPVAYSAGKALNAAAKSAGEAGYGALWAGEGAPRLRQGDAAGLIAVLARELAEAQPARN